LSDLWRLRGELSRARFIILASVLFAVKYNLDRILLRLFFDQEWGLLNYFQRPFPWIGRPPDNAPTEYGLLLAASLPFLWAGLALCLKRLRSAALPLWLAALFVVPILKWFLFLALSVVPDRKEQSVGRAEQKGSTARWLPTSSFGSAALAVGVSALLALGSTLLGATLLHEYGWGLFAGLPFCMGFLATLIFGARQSRPLKESLGVALLSLLLAGISLLVFAAEGLICILMAAPLAAVLSTIGAMVAHSIIIVRRREAPGELFCIPVLAIPLMLGSEHLCREVPVLVAVRTSVDVDASPEGVWRNVISFGELPPPTESLFKVGIAYPVRAEIQAFVDPTPHDQSA